MTNDYFTHDKKNMAKGYLLGFGATHLDAAYYGEDLVLEQSLTDVQKINHYAKERGYTTKIFEGEQATVSNFRIQIEYLTESLDPGDTLILYFSGYGSQVLNFQNRPLKTYCFADGQIAHFELLNWIAGFESDVNVVAILDCSHFPQLGGKTLPLSIANDLDGLAVSTSIYAHLPCNMEGGQNIIFLLASQKDQLAKEGVFTSALTEMLFEDLDTPIYEAWANVEKACEKFGQTPRIIIRNKK